jgi:hypothetical protein
MSTGLRAGTARIREHTRLGELALRWDARGRADSLLLCGEELAAAKTWLASRPLYAPEASLLHHEFINAAEDAEIALASAERQRLDQMAAAQEEREKALEREKEPFVHWAEHWQDVLIELAQRLGRSTGWEYCGGHTSAEPGVATLTGALYACLHVSALADRLLTKGVKRCDSWNGFQSVVSSPISSA